MSYTPPLEAEETGFKTTTPVLAGLTFNSTGSWDGAVDGYSQVQTEILASHDGTIAINFCADAGFTEVVRSLSIPYTAADGYQFFAAPAFANFIEYKFTNTAGSDQTDFYYTTKILTTAIAPQLLTTDAFIAPAMVTTLNRSILVGKDSNGVFTNTPHGGVNNDNSTTDNLGIGGVYEGTFVDTDGFAATSIFVKSDQDSAVGGLQIIHSSNDVDDQRVISFSYVTADNPQGLVYMIPASTRYFRIKYTNGGVAQTGTNFLISVKNETTALQTIALPVNLPVTNNTLANVVKSVIIGENDAGNFNNVKTDNENHLQVNVANPKSAYDELPIAELTPISQLTFPYNINTSLVNLPTPTSLGFVSQSNNMALISTGTSSLSSTAAIESKQTITYRAGQGALTRFSCLFTDNVPNATGSVQGIGVGDANDGYGFALIGNTLNISYRTNGAVDTPPSNQTNIPQSSWNTDTMDGTGPSGMTLDITKGNVYQVSYGSGFGCLNFSIENASTGDMVLVHVLHISNLRTTPSAYNPTFPLRGEVYKESADTNEYILKIADMSSFIEGDNVVTGPTNRYGDGAVPTADTNRRLLWAMRNSSDFPVTVAQTGRINKVGMIMGAIDVANGENQASSFEIVRDCSAGTSGAVWTDLSTDESVMQYSATNQGDIVAGGDGTIVYSGQVNKENQTSADLSSQKLILYPGETYTFIRTYFKAPQTTDPISISISWQEDF
jgi:hypothetical protein